VDAIFAEALTWPAVLGRPSEISVAGARALTLDEKLAGGPAEAFMAGREFCHVHAHGDFSLHATLPVRLAAAAERAGWAEPHFLVHAGKAPATVVMLYAPRDEHEREVILSLVRASYEFALTRTERAMSLYVVDQSGGEQSGGGPIRCRIIEDGSHTGHRLGLIEATVPPGPGAPPQHLHREHDETFIVTHGRLKFTSGIDTFDVEAGSCVTVPAGTPHTFANPFDEAATFLCALTPDLYVEYFRDLSKLPLDERGLLDPSDIGKAMARYATEVIR
jgi:mannose-6-phosphate isomerase-like protein (cupin superfamily)